MNKLTEAIVAVEDKKQEVYKAMQQLEDVFMELSDGALGLCVTTMTAYTQLYHHTEVCSVDEAYKKLQELADNGKLTNIYEDIDSIHYEFYIDKSRFIIVFDKEV